MRSSKMFLKERSSRKKNARKKTEYGRNAIISHAEVVMKDKKGSNHCRGCEPRESHVQAARKEQTALKSQLNAQCARRRCKGRRQNTHQHLKVNQVTSPKLAPSGHLASTPAVVAETKFSFTLAKTSGTSEVAPGIGEQRL
jgi:hypothetical protein